MKNININIKEKYKSIDVDKIYKLIQSLPNNYISSVNKNFNLNIVNLDSNKKLINEKLIEDGQNRKKLKYINNFEIIDINLSLMLSRIIKDINKLFIYGRFYFIKNKILIIFKDNETNSFYFEIGYLKDINIFIVEYLIDLNYDKSQIKMIDNFDIYFNEINSDIILNSIFNNKESNSFILEKIICNHYKLYGNDKKNNNVKIIDSLIENTQFFDDSIIQSKKENNNEKIKIYLELLINFYKLDKRIQSKLNKNSNIEEEFYILNENWINEFKIIFNYNEILTNQIKDLIANNENNSEIIEKIINNIPENIILKLNHIEESDIINQKMNNINSYKINKILNYNDDINKKPLLNHKYVLLNKDIFDSFKKNKINIKEEELEKANFIFLDKKLICIFGRKDNNSINIGYYEDNLYITEIIIILKDNKNINTIIGLFKENGYNKYMNYLLFENDIFYIKEKNINIIKISKDIDKHNYKELLISKRLKAFIFLSFYQYIIKEKTKKSYNKESEEEVLLVNPNWLDFCGYERIDEIVNEKCDNDFISNKKYDDIDSFNDFIFRINKNNEIKDINNNLIKLEIDANWFFQEQESIKLSNNKEIIYFNDFIVINKKISKLFFDSFRITFNYKFFKFYSRNKKNFIEINNNDKHLILLGSFLNEEDVFKLEFIFEYKEEKDLGKESKKIYDNYNIYINNNIIFNKKFENDCISPIFNESNYIIGYGFKYNENLLSKKFIENYDIKKELINMIQLLYYYEYINNELEKKNNSTKLFDYCLVNKEWMNNIKNFYDYDLLSKLLKSNKEIKNFLYNSKNQYYYNLKGLKTIYEFIKKMPPDILKEFYLKNKEKTTTYEINFAPNFIQVKNNKIPDLKALDNFEIINKKVVELLKDKNTKIDEIKYSECFIIDNYIIIHFEKDIFSKDKYITIIGKLKEFIFNLNYIIVYTDKCCREKHFNRIKNNISKFLNTYQNYNILENIIDNESQKSEAIGIIIKYSSNNNKDNYNNKIIKEITNNLMIYNNKIYNYLKKNINNNNTFKENSNIKLQNKELKENIEILRLDLIEEKNKNKTTDDKKLKIELEDEIKKYKDSTEKISEIIKNNNPIKKDTKENLLNLIITKDKEIEELKLKLSRYPLELKEREEINNNNYKYNEKLNKIKEEIDNEKDKNQKSLDEVSLNKNELKQEKYNNKKLSEEVLLYKSELKDEKDKYKKILEEISLYKNELKEERDKNKKLCEEVSLQKNELKEEKDKYKKLYEEVSLHKKELNEKKDKYKKLNEEVSLYKNELREEKDKSKKLSEEMALQKKETIEEKDKSKKLSEEISLQIKELLEEKDRNKKISEELSLYKIELNKEIDKYKKLTEEIALDKNKLKEGKNKIKKLSEEIILYKNDLEGEKDKSTKLTEEISLYKNKINEEKDKNKILSEEIVIYKKELNEEKDKNKKLLDEISLFKNELEKEKDINKKLSKDITLFKNELKEEKNINKQLSDEVSLYKGDKKAEKIKKLSEEVTLYKNDLKIEKDKNKKLLDQASLYEIEIKVEKEKNINLEKVLINLRKELEDNIKKYKFFEEKTNKDLKYYYLIKSKDTTLNAILERDEKIKELEKELKIKLSRYPFELKEGEELMIVNFRSVDQKIQNYSILCKKSDIFNILEKQLYEEYKEYYETENFFTVNGNKIQKMKSLEENNIHNNDVIMLYTIDSEEEN